MSAPHRSPSRPSRIAPPAAVMAAALAACCLVMSAPCATAQPTVPAAADTLVWNPPPAHFGRAALEVVGVNALVWSYDRFIREGGENPEFRIGFDSIWDNMQNRMEWDNNNFTTNNFAHPYHGSLYYNAARSNGFSYWESIPFVFAGSYLWEFAGERNNPAYNDWINTSVGGVGLGEALYRLSDLVLDDTATGDERVWRELGGLAIDPMRGFNRILSGEWSRVGANPPDRRPDWLGIQLEAGIRSQGRESLAREDTSGAFLRLDFLYGNPFTDDDIRPFDTFAFEAQVNFNDVSTLGHVRSEGLLTGRAMGGEADDFFDGGARHVVGAFQAFEFIDNRGYEFGGQTVGAMWLARRHLTDAGHLLQTDVGLGLLLLAGTSSEVANFSGRDYDYGSGVSYRLGARVLHRGRTLLEARTEGHWLATLNGVDGTYLVTISSVQATLPVTSSLGVGAEALGYHRSAWYDEFEDVSRWYPEVRGFVTLATH